MVVTTVRGADGRKSVRRLRTFAKRHLVFTAFSVIVATVLLVWGLAAAVGYARWRAFDHSVAAITADASGGEIARASWRFTWGESRVTAGVPYRPGELSASERLDSRWVFGSAAWLQRRYVRSVIEAESRSALIGDVAAVLGRQADRLGLATADDRLEFFTAAVQGIPYGTIQADVRLPVEVLAHGSGVCTEKTLLLASLLKHEGYDCVIWVFPTQRHVALGVATTGSGFRGSGYAFIETTRPAWIGESDPSYSAAGPVSYPPLQIDLGGERRYEAGLQVEYVLRVLDRARLDSSAYGPYTEYSSAIPGHGDEYAQIAVKSDYAQRIAELIETNPHMREKVFELLTAEGRRVP